MAESAAADDHLRVGTGERTTAMAALGEHFAAGRLDFGEYQQRLDAVTEARDRLQLREVFADLPPPHPDLPPAGTAADIAGPGRLPDELRSQLMSEGLVVLAEDLPGTMSYHRYRVPGQQIGNATRRVRGTLAVSRSRLLIWAAGAKRVDLPFTHPAWEAVDISAHDGDWLRVGVDVSVFGADRSGRIVLRLQTEQAEAVAALLAG
jgi:Domain of unknown function (DUF1707)